MAVVPCAAKPLKVYILAGQSNMVGHAKASTLPYLAEDPLTRPILEEILDADGKPRVQEGVFIKYWTASGYGGKDGPSEKQGELTAGFGGDPKQESRGPETLIPPPCHGGQGGFSGQTAG